MIKQNQMKLTDYDEWIYKNYMITKCEHPKLIGKYEVYSPNNRFIGRYHTLKECKLAINIDRDDYYKPEDH